MNKEVLIQCETYTPTGANRPVLFNVNLNVALGDRMVLIGKNGSGKSTLLNLIEHSFLKLFSRDQIRVLTQNAQDALFPSLTLLEHIRIFVSKDRLNSMDVRLVLQECHPALPEKLSQRVDTLSGGEKQAFLLALVMIAPPQVLLLDEHTSALDEEAHARILELTHRIITEQQLTSVVVTHHPEVRERLGSRFILLEHGHLYEEK